MVWVMLLHRGLGGGWNLIDILVWGDVGAIHKLEVKEYTE